MKVLASKYRLPALAALLAVLVVGFAWQSWNRVTPAVPHPDLEGASPRAVELVRRLQQAIHDNPADSARWGELGQVLMTHHWHVDAQVCFEHARHLDPKELRWHYLSAVIDEQSDLALAARSYERAAAVGPDYAPLRYRWAQVLMRLDRLLEAEVQLRQGARLAPQAPQFDIGLGRVALAREDLQAARQAFEQALAKAPRNRDAQLELARVQIRLGETPTGSIGQAHGTDEPLADPLLQQVEDREVVVRHLAMEADRLAAQGDFRAAAKAYQEVMEIRPDMSRPVLNLAAILMNQGKADAALAICREAVQRFPRDPLAHYALANALEATNDPAGAADHYRQSVAIKPDYAQAHFALGLILERQGKLESAIAAYRQAVDSDARFAPAQLALGAALAATGQRPEALEHMRNAVRLAPNDPVPRDALKKVLRADDK